MTDHTIFQTHFRLARLRANLYRAVEEGDAARIREISEQIDACQLKCWKEQKQENQCTG